MPRRPTLKNVAFAPRSRRIASSCGVHSRVGPSSIVSATTLVAGAVRNVTVVRYVSGPAGDAVRAVGPSAVTAGPAANPMLAPAPPPAANRLIPARNLRRFM